MARPALYPNDRQRDGFMSSISINGRKVVVVEKKLGRRTLPVPVDRRNELARQLEGIEERINRLSVSRHDPERFFVQRSEIADDLRRLAADLRT